MMNDLTRREFLKKASRLVGGGAAGLAAIQSFGLGAVQDARAWGILPALITNRVSRWDDWDESSESSLASNNTFVCFMENVIAGGNETGQGGGLSGADLVGTQAGNLAGASGSPPNRAYDETDDDMTFASAALSIPGSSGSVIIKAEDMKDYAPARVTYPFYSSSADSWIFYRRDNNSISVKLNGATLLNGSFATEIPEAGIVYLCIWWDRTYIRAAWKATTKPTKWSNFPVNNRLTATSACDFSAETMNAGEGLYHSGSSGICKICYIVISEDSLMNNAA